MAAAQHIYICTPAEPIYALERVRVKLENSTAVAAVQ